MSNTGWAVVIIIVIVILGGGWWWYSMQAPVPAATTAAVGAIATTTDQSGTVVPLTTTIHYTDSGFIPQTVTVANGGTVTWVNDTTGGMWVASDPHPVHDGYDGTTQQTHCAAGYAGPTPFDECASGSTYSFTFDKAGSWGFHNHLNESDGGTVTVEAAQ